MKKQYRKRVTITIAAAMMLISSLSAQNPIVQTCFTTDPAPVVFGDRIYVYTGHDEELITNPPVPGDPRGGMKTSRVNYYELELKEA